MDNYLLDYETLGKFVDELMKAKPMPANNPEELNALREEYIKKLDDRIAVAVFGSLNEEQLKEISALFDQDDGSPDAYEKFFKDADIDIQQVITDTMEKFKNDFLGGENA